MFFTEEKIKNNKNNKFNDIIFWDCDKNNIDLQKMKDFITERVIHIGTDSDFYALFNNYGGVNAVREIIKNLKHIDESDIGYISAMFELKEDDLRCLKEKSYKTELMHYLKKFGSIDNIKVDFVCEKNNLIEEVIEEDGIRLLGLKDMVANPEKVFC